MPSVLFAKHLKDKWHRYYDRIDEKTQISFVVNYEGNEYFYVRNGNSSSPKNRREQSEYEKAHWS